MPECELCCNNAATVVECAYGHCICPACQGTVCPFCHPHDYVKLGDPEVGSIEVTNEEEQEQVLRPLGGPTLLCRVTAGLALGAASMKGMCYAIYPADQELPAWMAWDDPNIGNWLVEGSLGLLGLGTILQCCCNMSFRFLLEESLCTR